MIPKLQSVLQTNLVTSLRECTCCIANNISLLAGAEQFVWVWIECRGSIRGTAVTRFEHGVCISDARQARGDNNTLRLAVQISMGGDLVWSFRV